MKAERKKLFRRDFLKLGSALSLAGLGLDGFRPQALAQNPNPSCMPLGLTREDLVHLFTGPWQGLRAVKEKKVIDIHSHLYRRRAPDGTFFVEADDMIASMDIHGIAQACVGISKMT